MRLPAARTQRRAAVAVLAALLILGSLLVLPKDVASAQPVATEPHRLPLGSYATALPGSDWPTYLGEVTRNAANAGEIELSSSDAANLTLLWNFTTGGRVESSPTVANGTAYVGSLDGNEYALNATSGALDWTQFAGLSSPSNCSARGQGIVSSATVDDGVVYVGGGDGEWYALNATTGEFLWDFDVGNASQGYYNWASPLVVDGFAYFGVSSQCDEPLVPGGLWQVALAAPHAHRLFATAPNGTLGASIWASPSYDSLTNTVFAVTGNQQDGTPTDPYAVAVLAWNASTMSLLDSWSVPANQSGNDSDFGATPSLLSLADGLPLLVTTNKNGFTYALNASDLAAGPVWKTAISSLTRCPTSNCARDPPNVAPVTYGGGLLYAGGAATSIDGVGYNGSVRALYPSNGTTKWVVPESADVLGAPAYANGLLIVPAGDSLQVRNASTGALLWAFEASAPFVSAPSVAHGTIYVGCTDHRVYAFGLRHPPSAYTVTFRQTGLPSGLAWEVTLAGHTRSTREPTLSFEEVNGIWPFSVDGPGGYAAAPAHGTVTLNGGPTSETVAFDLVRYSVSFHESGLPSGTPWSVDVAGDTNRSSGTWLEFPEPNGTYAFDVAPPPGFRATPQAGNVTVDGSPPPTVQVVFARTAPSQYAVTFIESGLPAGTSWSVAFGNGTNGSSSPSVGFLASNGTFAFSVDPVRGFTAVPGSGRVTVQGAPTSVSVTFRANLRNSSFDLTFVETGLAAGVVWSVTLNGSTVLSRSDAIAFGVPNGTYTFDVGPVTNYSLSSPRSSGWVTVDGAPVSVRVAFSPVVEGTPGPPNASRVASTAAPGSYAGFVVVPALGVALVAGALAQAIGARRARPERASPSTPPRTGPP